MTHVSRTFGKVGACAILVLASACGDDAATETAAAGSAAPTAGAGSTSSAGHSGRGGSSSSAAPRGNGGDAQNSGGDSGGYEPPQNQAGSKAASAGHGQSGNSAHAGSAQGGGSGKGWGSSGSGGGWSVGDNGQGGVQGWHVTDETTFPRVSVGTKQYLDLARLRVAARVEGLRARTVVDHVFCSKANLQLEGSFRYPLPAEASVSYFAVFSSGSDEAPQFFGPADALGAAGATTLASSSPESVVAGADAMLWGSGKEARVVKAVQATRAYEDTAHQQVDPALVEQVAPNTFEARVFPVPAGGCNRIVLAYEQTLPRLGDELEYRYPLAKGPIADFSFTLAADRSALSAISYTGSAAGMNQAHDDARHGYALSLAGESPGGTIAFRVTPVTSDAHGDVLTGTDPTSGELSFYARLTPDLSGLDQGASGARKAVFLVDTSLSEHPDQFGVNVQLLDAILSSSPGIEEFGVITFDAGARWLSGTMLHNDEQNRAFVRGVLEGVLLEGATDFSAALSALSQPPFAVNQDKAVDVFVLSDGVVNWGESDVDAMVARHEAQSPFASRFFAYRTGIAADNLELFAAITRRGAIFNCLSAADLPACATAHQTGGMVIDSISLISEEDSTIDVTNLLVAGRQATLFPGAAITLAGKLSAPGVGTFLIKGRTPAGPAEISVPVTFAPSGELSPRAWAEIAVTQLAATRDPSLEGLALALSQRYRVASRLGSFLMLENEADYHAYDLVEETEGVQGKPVAALVDASFSQQGAAYSSWQQIHDTLVSYADINHVTEVDEGKLLTTLASLAGDGQLELPAPTVTVPLVMTTDASSSYISSISKDPDVITPFTNEAEKRRASGDPGGAIRALSSLVENRSGEAQTERLVGYRISSWGEQAAADALFLHVLGRRPFEPQSYRDLANSLWLDRPALSALLFESVLSGTWDQKFGLMQTVVGEEYALLIQALSTQQAASPLTAYLASRRDALGLQTPWGDLRVTITWNTDDTDIDLWIIEPSGDACYFANPSTPSGGALLDDLTQGYGPERYQLTSAPKGTYEVQVHYYGNHSSTLSKETYVNVAIMTGLDSNKPHIERHNVVLSNVDDRVTVAKVVFE